MWRSIPVAVCQGLLLNLAFAHDLLYSATFLALGAAGYAARRQRLWQRVQGHVQHYSCCCSGEVSKAY